jgi:hypothetical protein
MPGKKIEIALKLSESDWAEVYYALDSKKSLVRQRFYPPMGPKDRQDTKKWATQLGRLVRTLKQQLHKNKVTY